MPLSKTLKLSFTCILTVLFISCKENPKDTDSLLDASANQLTINEYVIEVSMEGTVFQIKQQHLEPNSKSIFKKDSIFLEFWEAGNPLKLNLNLTNSSILETGTATYKIPDANAPKIKVHLNFYNADRDTKSMNKRIIFRKGIIEIKKLTNNELQMTFDGEGSGMMEYGKNFPISGKVDVTY